MSTVVFYHAGCPVCVSAEHDVLRLIDTNKVQIDVVHLGEQPQRVAEAEGKGVKSVPALITDTGSVLHLNFGAGIEDLKS